MNDSESKNYVSQETIYALATPPGKSAVAVIRLSGAHCLLAIQQLTTIQKLVPRKATLVMLREIESKRLIDQALCLYFPAPNSETGEDCAEFQIHGGIAIIQNLLDQLAKIPNLRLAEAGEFIRRSFYHKKLSLLQVEALSDLINAESQLQHQQAAQQLQGKMSEVYNYWAKKLTWCLAMTEATIDFADEDIPQNLHIEVTSAIQELKNSMKNQLSDSNQGEIIRDGIRITIVGPPNAGKSTLFNQLIGRNAAIVSAIAGTTRDVIEATIQIAGHKLIISDTAGIRETNDEIEIEGIRRTDQQINMAQIVIFMIEKQTILTEATDAFARLQLLNENCHLIKIVNKCEGTPNELNEIKSLAVKNSAICLSLNDAQAINSVVEEIENKIKIVFPPINNNITVITRQRHRLAISDALTSLNNIDSSDGTEIIAEELRYALHQIGKITGQVAVDDLLNVIFNEFCLGK